MATTRFARSATTRFARTFKALVSPLAIAIGRSNVYLSCRSRLQACHASVPEAPPTPAWHMCGSPIKDLEEADLFDLYEVMHVPLPETRFSETSGDTRTAEPAPSNHVDTTVLQPFHR
jgi:hypothetical protein